VLNGADWAHIEDPSASPGAAGLDPENGIAAGQPPVFVADRSRSQAIAFTFRAPDGFPMTHHVECVAHLVKKGAGLR